MRVEDKRQTELSPDQVGAAPQTKNEMDIDGLKALMACVYSDLDLMRIYMEKEDRNQKAGVKVLIARIYENVKAMGRSVSEDDLEALVKKINNPQKVK